MQTLFGGRDSLNGTPQNDTWFLVREDNTLGTDYVYRWWNPNPSGTAPARRSEHSAVAIPSYDEVVIFGGRDINDAPRADLHRLVKSGSNYQWSAINTSGTPPSARMGHIAIYNELTDTTGVVRRRMIV